MSDTDCLKFGKYEGVVFADVPTDYLDWLLGQSWLQAGLKERITLELQTRPDWLNKDLEE